MINYCMDMLLTSYFLVWETPNVKKKTFNWRNMELDENFAKVKEHLNWQIKILSLIMFQKNKNKD